MTVAWGTSSVLAEGVRANSTYTAPSGAAVGDLLLLVHFEFNGTTTAPTPTPPTGWSTPALGTWPITQTDTGGNKPAVWMWQADGGVSSYALTHTSCTTRGMVARITGASATLNALSQNSGTNSGSGTTTTFLGVTTTVDSDLVVVFGIDDNDLGGNLTPPTGSTPTFTEQIDDNHGNYAASGILSPAGATGNKTMSNNGNTGTAWFAIVVAAASGSTTLFGGPPTSYGNYFYQQR